MICGIETSQLFLTLIHWIGNMLVVKLEFKFFFYKLIITGLLTRLLIVL